MSTSPAVASPLIPSTSDVTAPSSIADLAGAGTSVWLDDLSRDRIVSGNLADVVATKGVVGVTTNPAIFAAAMSRGHAYDDQISQLAESRVTADSAVFAMATEDVRAACDVFQPIFAATDGVDGRVSLEVDPRLAADRDATVAQALQLAQTVERPNLMIKIPATEECLPAITEVLSHGVSVNVTLIFSVARYRQVMDAFMAGIEQAQRNGKDISTIHSVASFFISRVDSEIDKRLEAIGTSQAVQLKGSAALANARLAYSAFQEHLLENPAWQQLATAGAHVQRPLWASTSVKNPDYSDTLYVTELAGPHTVNTMPESTLDATIDHGQVQGDTLSTTAEESREVFARIAEAGVDLDSVWKVLESEGVEKFVASWKELLETLAGKLTK